MTDQECMASISGGDLSALNVLMERHSEIVKRVLGSLGAGQETEDLCQETFLRVITKCNTYQDEGEESFIWWIKKIAKSVAIDDLHRKRVRKCAVIRDDQVGFNDTSCDEIEVDEMLSKISKPKADVLRMCMKGMTLEEISIVIGDNHNTVKSRSRNGLNDLRELILV